MSKKKLYITECPRDAMQGIKDFIPTEEKIAYANSLLKVGFDAIDIGSFVSPKVMPQMQDTPELIDNIDLTAGNAQLLTIVANTRGADDALEFGEVKFLGFPLSLSEEFQQENTNKSIAEALRTIQEIQSLIADENKELVVYLSMGFGNPYDEPYDAEIVAKFSLALKSYGVKRIMLSDTIGIATPESIHDLFTKLLPQIKGVTIGAHLHSTPETSKEKIEAAIEAGVTYFDSAMRGFGGCPLAADELTGNIATEVLYSVVKEKGLKTNIDEKAYNEALSKTDELFGKYH